MRNIGESEYLKKQKDRYDEYEVNQNRRKFKTEYCSDVDTDRID
mgnify:CR=1 FL=1